MYFFGNNSGNCKICIKESFRENVCSDYLLKDFKVFFLVPL